jgi:hypothetical protein
MKSPLLFLRKQEFTEGKNNYAFSNRNLYKFPN